MAKQSFVSVFHKTFLYCFIFIPVSFLLYACPFSSVYKLDKDASVPVDESLTGKWSATVFNKKNQPQAIQVMISKKNELEYNMLFTGNFNELKAYKISRHDSISGSAFMSFINNRPMLNIVIKGQIYIASVVYKNDTLSLLPLADGFTAKYFKANSDLRAAVEVHFRTRVFPRYDDQFCLRKMVRIN